MGRSSSRAALIRATAVAFLWIILPHAASFAATTVTWDQARVSGIADKLAVSVNKLYDKEYKAPFSYGMGGEGSEHLFMDRLRRLQHETRHLATSLEKGASAKATIGSFRQIKELNDDLEEYGRSIDFVNPVLNQYADFEDLIRQLAPYYGLDKKR